MRSNVKYYNIFTIKPVDFYTLLCVIVSYLIPNLEKIKEISSYYKNKVESTYILKWCLK